MNCARRVLVGLTLAFAGCHHPSGATTPGATQQVVNAQGLALPSDLLDDVEVAACYPGIVLVPYGGGIGVVGFNKWIIEPHATPIIAVACDEQGDIFYLHPGELVRHSDASDLTIATPPGQWRLLATVDRTAWLYGTLVDGKTAIYFVDADAKLHLLYKGKRVLHAAAVVGTTGFAAVLDSELIVWSAGVGHSYGTLGPEVDGLAVGPDGTLYVSGPAGIARFAAGALSQPTQLARGIHGPLRLRGDVLYVLWRDAHLVMRLRPYERPTPPAYDEVAETITVPPSKFWNGPARDRKWSFKFDVGYFFASQSSALHLVESYGTAREVQFADPITFQGVEFGWNLGSFINKHVILGVELAIASGTGKPTSVVLDDTSSNEIKTGKLLTPASTNMFRALFPLGYRYATGWFSISAGSGLELDRYGVTAWQDKYDPPSTYGTSDGGVWFPAWGRFELEPWCHLTLYTQAGRSFSNSDLPDYTSISVGLAYHALPNCY